MPWTTMGFDPAAGVVTIPCGLCVTMDYNININEATSGELTLEHGLDIEGKLLFPANYKITVRTPFLYVQGILEMTSTRATSGEPDVKIILTGEDVHSLVPHADNAAMCGGSGCSVGNRPVIVAGGRLDVTGLPETCPSWVTLENVITADLSSESVVNFETYVAPAAGCSDVLVESDFENEDATSYPNNWVKNYGGSSSIVTDVDDDGIINRYGLYAGRTSTWNGPQTHIDHRCIVPDVEYFVSARAKLIGITEETCLQLTSYFYDRGATPERRWNNRGSVCTDKDDEWFDYRAVFRFGDSIDANPSDPTDSGSFWRKLYWEKPPAGVAIAIDDIK